MFKTFPSRDFNNALYPEKLNLLIKSSDSSIFTNREEFIFCITFKRNYLMKLKRSLPPIPDKRASLIQPNFKIGTISIGNLQEN